MSDKYKGRLVCKGSLLLGTGCNSCARCTDQRNKLVALTERVKELEANEMWLQEKLKSVDNHLRERLRDINKLEAELQAEREVVDFYADEINWQMHGDIENHLLINGHPLRQTMDSDDCGDDEYHCGKRARQRVAERKVK